MVLLTSAALASFSVIIVPSVDMMLSYAQTIDMPQEEKTQDSSQIVVSELVLDGRATRSNHRLLGKMVQHTRHESRNDRSSRRHSRDQTPRVH
mmetsp:Transcript_14551/g.20558  ORF Transcript_14551/g.20558 Transcript_14551/m.20558 type:complete len:93 (-) Transcript_14551:241-519(-)